MSEQIADIPFFSTAGSARILLAAAATYIFFASIFVCWVEVREWRPLNIYYLAMAGLAAFASASALKALRWRGHRALITRSAFAPLLLLAMGALAWGVYRYGYLFTHSLWLDEITQFQGDWRLPRQVADPALFAANQQQPPIDYYLSAFSRNVLGFNQLAAQANAILFSVLSLIAFLLWLIQIRFPVALAPIPILLFSSHHTFLRFSTEARPVSLAIFFALLTLLFAHERFRGGKVPANALFASALLLLYSIGLQPLFFLAALVIGLSPVAFLRLKKVEAMELIGAMGVAPFALFLPTLMDIYLASNAQSQFFERSYAAIWLSEARNLGWSSFEIFLETIRPAEWMLGIPLAALAIGLALRTFTPNRNAAALAAWGAAALLFSLLFPVFFQVFWGIIDWPKQSHYFALWPLGVFALASLCLADAHALLPAGRFLTSLNILLCLGGGYATYLLDQSYAIHHSRKIESIYSLRPNWHKILQGAQQSNRPVLVVGVPYGAYGRAPYHSVSGVFYEKPPAIRVALSSTKSGGYSWVSVMHLHETLGRYTFPTDILYVMTILRFSDDGPNQMRKRRLLEVIRKNVDQVTELGEDLFLLRANNQHFPLQKTKELFEAIVGADPGSKRNFYVVDALVNESIRTGECESAKMWFELMNPAIFSPGRQLDERAYKYLALVKEQVSSIPFCGPVMLGQTPEHAPPSASIAKDDIASNL